MCLWILAEENEHMFMEKLVQHVHSSYINEAEKARTSMKYYVNKLAYLSNEIYSKIKRKASDPQTSL